MLYIFKYQSVTNKSVNTNYSIFWILINKQANHMATNKASSSGYNNAAFHICCYFKFFMQAFSESVQ